MPEIKRAHWPLWQDLLLLVVLGLTPLLWLPAGYVVTGADATFPINPIGFFLDRFFTWNARFNCGLEAGTNPATLFFHGLQAMAYWVTRSLWLTQRIYYVTWFLMVLGSMYFLMTVMQGDRPRRIERLVAAIVYAFNPLMFNVWETTKAAELSACVATPAILALLVLVYRQRLRMVWGCLGVAVVAIVSSEMGASPPVFGISLVVWLSYVAAEHVRAIIRRAPRASLGRLYRTVAVGAVVYCLASAYWALPMAEELWKHLRGGAGEVLSAFQMADWLKGISAQTSLLNVARLQGAWDWYAGWNDEPYIAYASTFQQHPVLLLIGCLMPVGAYLAVVLRGGFWVWFFACLGVTATWFATGAHPPFEPVFLWLRERLPFFVMWRSPYYKFGVAIILCYGVLIGVTVQAIADRLHQRWPTPLMVFRRSGLRLTAASCAVLLILGAHLSYAYPLLTGAIVYTHERLPSIKLRMPAHVSQAAAWLDRDWARNRAFSLPRDGLDVYRWGYGSLVHVVNLGSRSPVMYGQDIISGRASAEAIREVAATALYEEGSRTLWRLFAMLGCQWFLLRNDSWFDFYGDTDSPAFVRERLTRQARVAPERRFGEWELYRIHHEVPLISWAARTTIVHGGLEALVPLSSLPGVLGATPVQFTTELTYPTFRDLVDQQRIGQVVLYNSHITDFLLPLAEHTVVTTVRPPTAEVQMTAATSSLHEIWMDAVPGDRDATPLCFQDGTRPVPRNPARGMAWSRLGTTYLTQGRHTITCAGLPASTSRILIIERTGHEQLRREAASWGSPEGLRFLQVYTPTRMAKVLEKRQQGFAITYSDFAPPQVGFPDGERWHWMRGVKGHLVITNETGAAMTTSVMMDVFGLGVDRQVTVELNGVYQRTLQVQANATTALELPGVILQPGENRLQLFSPEGAYPPPCDPADDQRPVSVAVSGVALGAIWLAVEADIPQAGSYTIRLVPFARPPTDEAPRSDSMQLSVAGAPPITAALTKTPQGDVWYETPPTPLPTGTLRLAFLPRTGESYTVMILPVDWTPHPPIPGWWRRVNPTRFEAHVPREAPAFVTLREAWNEDWIAYTAPRHVVTSWWGRLLGPLAARARLIKQHRSVDGYANGWWVNAHEIAVEPVLVIEYWPQRLVLLGGLLTGLLIVGLGFALLAGRRR